MKVHFSSRGIWADRFEGYLSGSLYSMINETYVPCGSKNILPYAFLSLSSCYSRLFSDDSTSRSPVNLFLLSLLTHPCLISSSNACLVASTTPSILVKNPRHLFLITSNSQSLQTLYPSLSPSNFLHDNNPCNTQL